MRTPRCCHTQEAYAGARHEPGNFRREEVRLATTTASAAGRIRWACPQCGAAIEWRGDAANCAIHGTTGRQTGDGIYEFDTSDAYWGEVDRDRMRAINDAAREHGWRQALETELRPTHPGLMDYVQHPARADWRVLLPLDRNRSVILDVGAGWGANSFGVAPDVACVVAAEKMAERIEWIARRAAQDEVHNLVPVRAELHALPFAPATFDAIVVNGVLEWAGLVDPAPRDGRAANPRRLQEDFLRRLHALLRPGGWLYVGIENRFARMFWLGLPDHQGLRFTSLLPKPVARAYTALRAIRAPRTYNVERDYRAWIYSFAGYREMLEDCGFDAVRRYAAIPGYNVPSALVPLESVGPMRYYVDRVRARPGVWARTRRMLARSGAASGLEAWATDCYAIVARRGEPHA